jgi:hypothetical protein
VNVFSRNPYNDEPGGLKRRLADLPPGIRWGALAAALIAVIFIGWLGIQGLAAKSNLEKARTSAEQSKDALLSGKSEDATRFAENAQFHARQARAATHSLPWKIAAAVPMVGSPLKTTQQISDVVVGLADDVLLPAAGMGAGLSPDKLIDGTRLDLKLLRAEQPRLSELAAAAANLDANAQSISKPAYLSLIVNARSELQDQTSKLAQLLENTALAAKLAPSMLGGDGPRTYLMGFQTPAEARGTGGLLGGFAILNFENGNPTVDALATNTALRAASADIDLGSEFNRQYGYQQSYKDFRNSNLSSHFPYAAQIWQSMWEEESGTTVDGVISIDPVALSYLLGALGPVTLPDGELISAENVVELTMSTAYIRFPNEAEQPARKKFLQEIALAVVEKATRNPLLPRSFFDALGRAASEGRIAVWSSLPAEQKILEETSLGHAIPDDSAPYAAVVVNNLAGNKMDYYLKREIEYAADGCDGSTRYSTITVRLTNTATPDLQLPDFYAGTAGLDRDIGVGRVPLKVPIGTMVTSVRVLATKGSTLMSVTSNGERTSAFTSTERGHPSFEVQVAIPPGTSGDVTFRLIEPTSSGSPRVPIQPLIDSVVPKVNVPTCRG